MKVKEGLLIGELSRQVGIPVGTIRYYERLGLLSPPLRTQSQYRVYSQAAQERLRFIQKAKRFGLSLDEIKKLIDLSASGVPPCASLKVMVKQHLNDLDRWIQEMVALRQELASRYEQIDALLPDSSTALTKASYDGKICGIIERDNS